MSSSLPRWVLPAAAVPIALAAWIVFGRQANSASAAPDPLASETSPLGLNVERRGNYLKVSWKRDHPFLRRARQAVLSIVEGSAERLVRFESGELASGTVLYEAASNDVVFNLNVRDGRNHLMSESVRAIASPLNPAPDREVETSTTTADPGVLEKVLPPPSPRARATIHGTLRIDVMVNMDSSGAVTGAELTGASKSEYFSKVALETARKWKFASGGARSRVVRFEFTSGEPRAFIVPSTP